MTDKTTEKGLTLADLDALDAAYYRRLVGGFEHAEYVTRIVKHAPAMRAAIRVLLKVVRAEAHLLKMESALGADDTMKGMRLLAGLKLLDALREFQAGPFAGLLETVSGEGGEDAKT
jgi:hypothetical protein